MLKQGETFCPIVTAGFGPHLDSRVACDPIHCMWAIRTTKLIDGKWHRVGYRCAFAVGGNEVGPYEGTDRP